ncbi:Dedicator of cytokinesis protein 1 [Liparis tanakae]|uniref:Dedicator of cytokinesis protein 1 n=1 Tax=Liparis tanakae TaxID=230148 RepID=A0A4Z2I9T4_9TELE|nr:Dedicator of cytokinesis protein 1 [Liparis tanakae]
MSLTEVEDGKAEVTPVIVEMLNNRIPHLSEGVRIHGEKVTEALRPFHDRLEACFKQLREKVEKQYGVKTLDCDRVRPSPFRSPPPPPYISGQNITAQPAADERRGSRPHSMVRSFTMPSSQRPLSVASVTSISSDNSPSRPGSDGFALEPLLPKKLHNKSQDKLDRDESERERKEKKKEKRNSKHQEIFDKEMKTTEIPLQHAEAVILSETISPLRPQRPRSQVLSQIGGDRRLSVSPGPPSSSSSNSSSSLGPPPITPRSKLSFSLHAVSTPSSSSAQQDPPSTSSQDHQETGLHRFGNSAVSKDAGGPNDTSKQRSPLPPQSFDVYAVCSGEQADRSSP